MSLYEIEIKSLLGNSERASSLRGKIKEKGGMFLNSHKQLNHYFILSDIKKFRDALLPKIEKSKKELFRKILDDGREFSVRTREADDKVILVVKASIGTDTSANGISRMEFESEMNMTLDELDKLLLDAGLQYQAKWSREREGYKLGDAVKKELLGLMKDFEVEELPQDRLERMFAHYNKNWRDYYGTDKIFNIA